MARMWTEQDKENLVLYGPCPECGAPREMRQTETFEPTGEVTERGWPVFGGTATMLRELICPNGHPQ